MAEQNFSFRSALHGFNRDDVMRYLSELSNAHAAELEAKDEELRQAKEEITHMKQELMCMRMLSLDGSEDLSEDLPTEKPVEEKAVEEASAEKPLTVNEPVPGIPLQEQELEAYRRAERCEREARVRADKIYGETCSIVEKAREQISDQESKLAEMNSTIANDISELQSVMNQICDHLSATQAHMQEMEKSLQAEQ